MSRNLVIIVLATTFLLVAGIVARLAVRGVNEGPLFSYFSIVLPLLVPVVSGLFIAHSAKTSADSGAVASNAAQQASEQAQSAASEAATNTNGKMDVRFAEVRKAIGDLQGTVNRHLELHASQEGGSNAGSS